MERISLPIPAELTAQIDEVRGDVPRTVWIRRAIEMRLNGPSRESVRQADALIRAGVNRKRGK